MSSPASLRFGSSSEPSESHGKKVKSTHSSIIADRGPGTRSRPCPKQPIIGVSVVPVGKRERTMVYRNAAERL